MLLSVEDLKAARSQKDATDAAGPCGEVSRRSSPSVQDARDTESVFFLLVGDAPQVAITGATRFWRRCACLRRPECSVVPCSAVRAARAMRCVVRAELWDLQARIWSCQDTRATCFEVENTLSGKMRLKGKRRSGEKWGGLSGKSVWAPLFFFELRVLFNVLGGAARPLADARVAGRRWVIRSPVARAAVRRVPA